MSDLNRYAKFWVTYNGALITEEASLQFSHDPGLQRVDTVCKGFAGVSQGSASMGFTVDSKVPQAGFELVSLDQDALDANIIEIGIIHPGSGKQLMAKGFIMATNGGHAVNSEATISFTALAQYNVFE